MRAKRVACVVVGLSRLDYTSIFLSFGVSPLLIDTYMYEGMLMGEGAGRVLARANCA